MPRATVAPTGPESLDLEQHLEQTERAIIERALAASGGNRTQAARLLGISRNGLAIKMERLGLGSDLEVAPTMPYFKI